jgi:serine/threonine protein phosphatase PrpC
MAVEEMKRALESAREQVRSFAEHPDDDGRRQLVSLLESSVQKAHQAVFERGGRESDKKGMGTTLDVVLIADAEAFVAHVGDSRTYLVRAGSVAQVTTDHTVAEVLVIEGKLTAEEARLSPLRTILVNAIGVSPDVGVELAHIRLRKGDKLLLCSDGLHDYFPMEAELADLLSRSSGAAGLEKMVALAKERGGHDNITGVLVEVVEGHASVEEEADTARGVGETLGATEEIAVPQAVGEEPTIPSSSADGSAKDPVSDVAKREKSE